MRDGQQALAGLSLRRAGPVPGRAVARIGDNTGPMPKTLPPAAAARPFRWWSTWWIAGPALLLVAVIALLLAYRLALQRIEGSLRDALGPRATVGEVDLGLTGLTVRQLQIKAAPGWPADTELRASAVRVQPDITSVLGALRGGPWRLERITVDDASLSLLRTRQGKLRLLPALIPEPAAEPTKPAGKAGKTAPAPARAAPVAPLLVIDHVELRGLQVDFFDATLPGPVPHRLRLHRLQAQIDHLVIPTLDEAVALDLSAQVQGSAPDADGSLSLKGQFTPATKDAEIKADLRKVDLKVLQPYLLKVAEGGVRRGTLDLAVQATVKDQHLKAPGRVTLTELDLADGPGWWDQVAGAPRKAVLAVLKDKGQIAMDFTIEGRLDDPGFSLNENLAKRFASGMAEAVGVSVGGVVQGVGSMVKGLFGR